MIIVNVYFTYINSVKKTNKKTNKNKNKNKDYRIDNNISSSPEFSTRIYPK